MNRLDGKVAIITGAARGQGAAEARLFAREGARVVISDVLEGEGREVAEDIGETARFIRHDVTDGSSWQRLVDSAVDDFGGVDILINNAAILEMKSLEETTQEDFERTIDVNLLGPFLGMKSVIEIMRSRGGGSIVNVSSIDGMVGMNGVAAYASAKFGLRGMTKVAALELGKYGIRVNTLHPGGVDTPMWGAATDEVKSSAFRMQALPRIGKPEEIANLALFLAGDESSYCTGAEFLADGGHCAGARVEEAPGF